MEFSRIVLLGHSGYIGSRLRKVLELAAPHTPVIGRSIRELDLTAANASTSLGALLEPGCALVICAAIKKQLGDNSDTFFKNLEITNSICSTLQSQPVRRVVFFSSAAVYGEDVQHDLISEVTPVVPTSFYGIGKFASERMLHRAATLSGTTLCILRPALVYGPDEPGYYYGPSGFLNKIRSGEPIALWGDGEELREFLYVDDVVAVAAQLVLGDFSGILNVASGRSYSYREALDIASRLTGRRPVITSRARSKEKVDHRFDPTTLRAVCPTARFRPLEDGLRSVANGTNVSPVEAAVP